MSARASSFHFRGKDVVLADIGRALNVATLLAEVRQAAKGRSTDPEALRLYLLARHFMDQFNRDATAKAIGHLTQLKSVLGRPDAAIGIDQRSLEQDPLSAAAYHSLGVALHAVGATPGSRTCVRSRACAACAKTRAGRRSSRG